MYNVLQPGVIVGVQYMDKLQWTKGFGAKDRANPNLPPDADTIFRIASITKVFVVSYNCTTYIAINYSYSFSVLYIKYFIYVISAYDVTSSYSFHGLKTCLDVRRT